MDRFNLDQVLKRLEVQKRGVGLTLANIAKNEFLGNFKEQGFDGKKWQEVQRRIPNTAAYKGNKDKGKRTRAILIGKGSGRLRRDVANSVQTGNKIGELGYKLVVQNDYGIYHNKGAKDLPKRQFVGHTNKLNKKLLTKLNTIIKKAWQG